MELTFWRYWAFSVNKVQSMKQCSTELITWKIPLAPRCNLPFSFSPCPLCRVVFACWCVSIWQVVCKSYCVPWAGWWGEQEPNKMLHSLILGCRLWGSSWSCVTGPGASASLPNWPLYLILSLVQLQTELLGIASEQQVAQEPLSVREWGATPCRKTARWWT